MTRSWSDGNLGGDQGLHSLVEDHLISCQSLVELLEHADMICPVVQVQLSIVGYFGKRHYRSTAITSPNTLMISRNQIATTHLTFERDECVRVFS